MKARAKTLQERMGFVDRDLTTPSHDAIMVWLDKHVMGLLGRMQRSWSEWDVKCWSEHGVGQMPDWQGPKLADKVWERPVKDRSYVVGFIDLWVRIREPRILAFDGKPAYVSWRDSEIGFEVKSEIPSLGEVIRQVRLYQEYEPGIVYAVVSPDDRFMANIVDQGIPFFRVPPIETMRGEDGVNVYVREATCDD